jgi:hypothetical protein
MIQSARPNLRTHPVPVPMQPFGAVGHEKLIRIRPAAGEPAHHIGRWGQETSGTPADIDLETSTSLCLQLIAALSGQLQGMFELTRAPEANVHNDLSYPILSSVRLTAGSRLTMRRQR